MIENPITRISTSYCRSTPDGLEVDTEAMASDLIAVFKMGGHSLEDLIALIIQTWPLIEAGLAIPTKSKH